MIIAFRTDGSKWIGTGHVTRCLALADALRADAHRVIFIVRESESNPTALIRDEYGFDMRLLAVGPEYPELRLGSVDEQTLDAEATEEALPTEEVDWLVVDHYSLDATWERRLRQRVEHVLAIDDLANRSHDCDILLDQNYPGRPDRYDHLISPGAIRLLGPGYALLRAEFPERREQVEIPRSFRRGSTCRINVSFGGVDPNNATTIAIEGLRRWMESCFVEARVEVILGGFNPHREAVRQRLRGLSSAQLAVGVSDMAERMAAADLAVGAGGSTLWERACLGLPTIIVTTAANQVAASQALAADGLALYAGHETEVSPEAIALILERAFEQPKRLSAMSASFAELVDGLGAQRVVMAIRDLSDRNGRRHCRG